MVSMLLHTARCCAYSTRWHSWLQNGVALQPGHQLGRMRSDMGLPHVAHLDNMGKRGAGAGKWRDGVNNGQVGAVQNALPRSATGQLAKAKGGYSWDASHRHWALPAHGSMPLAAGLIQELGAAWCRQMGADL